MNEFITTLLAVSGGMIVYRLVIAIYEKFTSSEKAIASSGGAKPSLATFLEELNLIIQLEVFAQLDVPQAVKEIPLIHDFQELQQSIIHTVIGSLSTRMWLEANKAGVTRKYVITYVTRKVQAEMMTFMENHNYALTNPPSEEYIERIQKKLG